MNDGGALRVTFRGTVAELEGRCWCGRMYACADPGRMWTWLDEHEHLTRTG